MEEKLHKTLVSLQQIQFQTWLVMVIFNALNNLTILLSFQIYCSRFLTYAIFRKCLELLPSIKQFYYPFTWMDVYSYINVYYLKTKPIVLSLYIIYETIVILQVKRISDIFGSFWCVKYNINYDNLSLVLTFIHLFCTNHHFSRNNDSFHYSEIYILYIVNKNLFKYEGDK